MIKKKYIGARMSFIAPNGLPMRLTINENDVSLYRKLGLDIFHNIKAKELKPLDPSEMNWNDLKAYAKKNGFEGANKKDILNAIAEGNK